jgi:hypothetical protein
LAVALRCAVVRPVVRPVVRRELLLERRVLALLERRVLPLELERRVPVERRGVLLWVAMSRVLLLALSVRANVVSFNVNRTVAGERLFVNLRAVTWVTEAISAPVRPARAGASNCGER